MDDSQSPSSLCVRSHPQEFALRPTQKGDVCILLEPSDDEMPRIRTHQAALQTIFGGMPSPLVHLTCLRFDHNTFTQRAMGNDEECTMLIDYFSTKPFNSAPFTLSVVGWVPLYVPFEGWNVLKWCIEITSSLRAFINYVYQAVSTVGYRPLYYSWFVPTLTTALINIPSLEEHDPSLINMSFPYPLFTAKRFELSRINGPHDFTILASFKISS